MVVHVGAGEAGAQRVASGEVGPDLDLGDGTSSAASTVVQKDSGSPLGITGTASQTCSA